MSAVTKPGASRGLSMLHEVELTEPFRSIYAQVAPGAAGPEPWRRRKLAGAHELLVLAQVSGRVVLQYLELAASLRTVFLLKVPVPCRPAGGEFVVAPTALLGLTYKQEAMLTAQPGYSFLEILEPRDVFHSNVSNAPPGQMLCLGPQLPAGIRISELVLMAYTALSLQTIQFSLVDPAGVLNPAAARWFQANPATIPLTKEPFLSHQEART